MVVAPGRRVQRMRGVYRLAQHHYNFRLWIVRHDALYRYSGIEIPAGRLTGYPFRRCGRKKGPILVVGAYSSLCPQIRTEEFRLLHVRHEYRRMF